MLELINQIIKKFIILNILRITASKLSKLSTTSLAFVGPNYPNAYLEAIWEYLLQFICIQKAVRLTDGPKFDEIFRIAKQLFNREKSISLIQSRLD